MTNRLSAAMAIAAASFVFGCESTSTAQVYRGYGRRGIVINVPGVAVRLGPGISIGGPYVPRRGLIVGPYGAAPDYPPRPLPPSVGRGPSLPTAGELRAMSDSDLLNAVVGIRAQLEADLGRFTSAATWQRYLRFPDDALPPPTSDGRVVLGLPSILETLSRFQSTVANPQYVQISGLPSFAATQAALEEVVRRFAGEAPAAAGSLQSPGVPAQPVPPIAGAVPGNGPSGNGPSGVGRPSIEMQNLRAERRTAKPPAQPASAGEELPAPPPALVAPENSGVPERSILAN